MTPPAELSIQQVLKRYGVSKQTLYDNYFPKLGIVPTRYGKQSYITQADDEKLAFVMTKLRSGECKSVEEAVKALTSTGVTITPLPPKEPATAKHSNCESTWMAFCKDGEIPA